MSNKEISKRSLPPAGTVLTMLIIGILFYLLFSGKTYQFYASFLFWFYSLTNSMWISVVGLGLFQVLLLIPIRTINLYQAGHVKEFEEKLEEIKNEKDQYILFKKRVRAGDFTTLWYSVNFFLQIISYFSIGRLFLTDFYSKKLNPELLYSWVKYPQYPIEGRWFKIPYPQPTGTVDLGWGWVIAAWGGIIVFKIVKDSLVKIYRNRQAEIIKENKDQQIIKDDAVSRSLKKTLHFVDGFSILLLIISYFLVRNWPTGMRLGIFSGDVSVPNIRLNTITAISTALTIFWLDLPKIERKISLARKKGFSSQVIQQTEKDLFKNTLRTAIFLGLGAFFITNHIPSAFELSIFTLEIVAWFSPLTLDRVILKTTKI